jgi:predicted transcriptional regulator
MNYRVGSLSYWTGDKNIVIISNKKNKILDLLKKPRRTSEISDLLDVDPKSSFKRLKELEELNLVRKNDKFWYRIPSEKGVIVYNISNRDR